MKVFNNDKLKVYFDTEFTGLHQGTTLVSIGLVSETGEHFYAESTDYDKSQVNPWIEANVINRLKFKDYNEAYRVMTKNGIMADTSTISNELRAWLYMLNVKYNKQIQMYSDCLAYDWVLFNRLVSDDGSALTIPSSVYYIPVDLCSVLQYANIDPDINREKFMGLDVPEGYPFDSVSKHNALWDAYVIKECFQKIDKIYQSTNISCI